MHGPHQNQPVLHTGKPLEAAAAVMILIHGRGASAQSILSLSQELYHADMAYLAPQANSNTWYPYSFLEPLERNEPGISSGLAAIDELVENVAAHGITPDKIIIGGFSQGACLSLEYVARHAQRYGGVFGYSGGLIGPDATPRDYDGTLAGTPVFLGCSDVDFHIPKARVLESERVLKTLGGTVDARLYAGMGHTVNADEIEAVQAIIAQVLAA